MIEEDYNMWGYWEHKYGTVLALTVHYPELLRSRADLQQAVAMIENGERVINAIMEELSTE